MFTGGIFETNSYYLGSSAVLIDAPEGVAEWLTSRGYKVRALLLTHGHVDHVWDAARVQREHGCELYYHADTAPMVLEPDFYRRIGLPWSVDPVSKGVLLAENSDWEVCGQRFSILEVPGHCPGSLCFYDRAAGIVFGGDVLFAQGVGRWDLPGGDKDLLLDGIRKKLLVLEDSVRVLAGHGPSTTIGIERLHNPYL